MDPIIRLLLTIALIGLMLWALLAFVPLPSPFGHILIGVGVIACILLAFRALGGSRL